MCYLTLAQAVSHTLPARRNHPRRALYQSRGQVCKNKGIEDPLHKVPPTSRGKPTLARFPTRSGGNRNLARFPSRSGGNLQEGGNCKLCPCDWYNPVGADLRVCPLSHKKAGRGQRLSPARHSVYPHPLVPLSRKAGVGGFWSAEAELPPTLKLRFSTPNRSLREGNQAARPFGSPCEQGEP